jgi:hypothetical protein
MKLRLRAPRILLERSNGCCCATRSQQEVIPTPVQEAQQQARHLEEAAGRCSVGGGAAPAMTPEAEHEEADAGIAGSFDERIGRLEEELRQRDLVIERLEQRCGALAPLGKIAVVLFSAFFGADASRRVHHN